MALPANSGHQKNYWAIQWPSMWMTKGVSGQVLPSAVTILNLISAPIPIGNTLQLHSQRLKIAAHFYTVNSRRKKVHKTNAFLIVITMAATIGAILLL